MSAPTTSLMEAPCPTDDCYAPVVVDVNELPCDTVCSEGHGVQVDSEMIRQVGVIGERAVLVLKPGEVQGGSS